MGAPRDSRKKTKQVHADSSNYKTIEEGPWMLFYGGTTFRILDERRGLTGTYRHFVRYRTAEVTPDFPDAWTDSANVRSANGINVEDFTPAAAKMWIQAAVAASVSGVIGEAQISLQAMTKSNGEIVASQTIQLQQDLNSTQTGIVPLGEPFPALGLAGCLAGVVLTGVGGTADYQLAIRYMDRLDEPGAWTAIGNAVTGVTGNDRRNTGDISITPSTNMWAQLGWQYTAAYRGTAQIVAAIRRS